MAAIQEAVSRYTDPTLRDDVVSEMLLAVLEGRLDSSDIKRAARSFLMRGINEWQSRWGPRSTDKKLSDQGEATIGDMVADSTTADQMSDLLIGGAQ